MFGKQQRAGALYGAGIKSSAREFADKD